MDPAAGKRIHVRESNGGVRQAFDPYGPSPQVPPPRYPFSRPRRDNRRRFCQLGGKARIGPTIGEEGSEEAGQGSDKQEAAGVGSEFHPILLSAVRVRQGHGRHVHACQGLGESGGNSRRAANTWTLRLVRSPLGWEWRSQHRVQRGGEAGRSGSTAQRLRPHRRLCGRHHPWRLGGRPELQQPATRLGVDDADGLSRSFLGPGYPRPRGWLRRTPNVRRHVQHAGQVTCTLSRPDGAGRLSEPASPPDFQLPGLPRLSKEEPDTLGECRFTCPV